MALDEALEAPEDEAEGWLDAISIEMDFSTLTHDDTDGPQITLNCLSITVSFLIKSSLALAPSISRLVVKIPSSANGQSQPTMILICGWTFSPNI